MYCFRRFFNASKKYMLSLEMSRDSHFVYVVCVDGV